MTQPRKHRHADMMRRWLDDESLEVEWLTSLGKWVIDPDPDWDEGAELRFKSKMIKCGDMEFPAPMRVAPAIETSYWIPYLEGSRITVKYVWQEDLFDVGYLKHGLCHTTQAAAEAHARALTALTESKS